jgi:hypothetical protein
MIWYAERKYGPHVKVTQSQSQNPYKIKYINENILCVYDDFKYLY